MGLVRAWASSRGALVATLQRRMHAVTALEQCAASGLAPTRRELRAWQGAAADVQLALAPLLVACRSERGKQGLLDAVSAEHAALDRLRAVLRDTPDPDLARVAALRTLRSDHPGVRILAFGEFASTIRSYFGLLASDAGVGMLTANEARIASGRLSRDELLDRFAPSAQGARQPPLRERVLLLLATDLLSEGVNLQDASIVVHLDLPWNPARLAQRLGRVRRPGGATVVESWLMSPPATSELLLRVEERLRAKLARAEHAIGRALQVVPALAPSAHPTAAHGLSTARDDDIVHASAEVLGAIADQVTSWRRDHPRRRAGRVAEPLVGAAECEEVGWLAALSDGRLLARVGSWPPDTGRTVANAVKLACCRARTCHADERTSALAEAGTWLERERITLACGVGHERSMLDAAIERRIAGVLSHAPRHARAHLLELATMLRARLGQSRPLGAERELEQLVAMHGDQLLDDAEWLARSLRVTERSPARIGGSEAPRVVALIVLGPRQEE